MTDSNILLVLDDSTNANKFTGNNLIHKEEFDSTNALIRIALHQLVDTPEKQNLHNTITILGTRGSGKTSFLLSIEEEWKNHADVQTLKIIDPTLIEEKGHVFLNVISAISELVNDKLEDLQVGKQDRYGSEYNWKQWRESLMKLAEGLPSIDGVGGSHTDGWMDAEFVMDNGLKAVGAARNLEVNFRKLLELALKILNKKAFLVIFDDIDVDVAKGMAVLETIRKYFTTSSVITILSGDLKMYTKLIRQKKWKSFGNDILKYEGEVLKKIDDFNDIVTELTGQYLLKILQPKNRIHLTTLYEKKNIRSTHVVEVTRAHSNSRDSIESRYCSIFKRFGITNVTQTTFYTDFMMNLPMRTQIQFLLVMDGRGQPDVISNNNITDIFLSDLLEKDVDINIVNYAPKHLNAIILKLLMKERRLLDLYLIHPASIDGSLNACLFAFNLITANSIINGNTFIIFDYFIRIGYLRNLLGIIPHRETDRMPPPSMEDLCGKTGVYNDISIRDVTGHMLGYIYGTFERNSQTASVTHSFIRLNALYSSRKVKSEDRLDEVFRNASVLHKTIAYIPAFLGEYNYKNESRVFYSVYVIIAAIGEIVKRYQMISGSDGENRLVPSIKAAMVELSQLRSYPIPNFSPDKSLDFNSSMDDEHNVESSKNSSDDELDVFVKKMMAWVNFSERPLRVTPNLMGRVATRFFYAMTNLVNSSRNLALGDLIHAQVMALFNAILIEDVRENTNILYKLNINNTQSDDGIFVNNLKKVVDMGSEEADKLLFSRWLLSCPLLLVYMRKDDIQFVNNLSSFTNAQIEHTNFDRKFNQMLNKVSIHGRKSSIASNRTTLENTDEYFGQLANYLISQDAPYEWFKFMQPQARKIEWNGAIRKRFPQFFGSSVKETGKISIAKFRKYLHDHDISW